VMPATSSSTVATEHWINCYDRRSRAAVLVSNATVERAHPHGALEAGADGVIDKISSPEEIISAIRRVGGG
jgi:DNA-binding NarL/FixJ family response regulator